jgi:hypothetical protein
MLLLTLAASVVFMHLYSAHAANALSWSHDFMVQQKSKREPAIAVFNNKLYVAYVAPDDTGRLYVTASSIDSVWPTNGTFTYLSALMDTQNGTSIAPVLAVYNNTLYLVYVADYSYQLMIASSSDGTKWSTPTPVPNVYIEKTPSLAVYNNQLYVAYVGPKTDGKMYINSYNGANWSGAIQVSSPTVTQYSATSPSLAAFNNKLYIAYATSNGNVLYASYDGTGWSNGTSTGQITQSTPTLTVFNNEIYIAFADNGNNDHLIYISGNGITWPASTWVPDQYTKKTPAMAVFNGKLCIVFFANNTSRDLLIVSGTVTSASS